MCPSLLATAAGWTSMNTLCRRLRLSAAAVIVKPQCDRPCLVASCSCLGGLCVVVWREQDAGWTKQGPFAPAAKRSLPRETSKSVAILWMIADRTVSPSQHGSRSQFSHFYSVIAVKGWPATARRSSIRPLLIHLVFNVATGCSWVGLTTTTTTRRVSCSSESLDWLTVSQWGRETIEERRERVVWPHSTGYNPTNSAGARRVIGDRESRATFSFSSPSARRNSHDCSLPWNMTQNGKSGANHSNILLCHGLFDNCSGLELLVWQQFHHREWHRSACQSSPLSYIHWWWWWWCKWITTHILGWGGKILLLNCDKRLVGWSILLLFSRNSPLNHFQREGSSCSFIVIITSIIISRGKDFQGKLRVETYVCGVEIAC